MQAAPHPAHDVLLTEADINRIRWRCRRGLLENDIFIARFFARYATQLTPGDAIALLALMDLGDVLGIIDPSSMKPAAGNAKEDEGELANAEKIVEGLVELLLDVRARAREAKEYGVSDMIRDRLAEMDIIVEDTRDGARWKFASK